MQKDETFRGPHPLRGRVAPLVGLVAAAALVAGGCGGRVDLTESLQVSSVTTGFMAVAPQDGQNKIVPAVSFRLTNVGSRALDTLQLNAVFRIVDTPEDEQGTTFLHTVSDGALEPGQATEPFTLHSERGYTGEQPPAEMFHHEGFRDMKVELYAKFRAQKWEKVGEYPITRQVLATAS